MTMHHIVGGRLLVLFRGLKIPEESFADGAGIPIEGATYCQGAPFHLRPAPCSSLFVPVPSALSKVPLRGLNAR